MAKTKEQLLDEIEQLKEMRGNRLYEEYFEELQKQIEELQKEYYSK